MKYRNRKILQTIFPVCLLVFSCFIIVDARRLPAPAFEPLGAAAIPTAIAGIVLLLGLFLLRASWLQEEDVSGLEAGRERSGPRKRYDLVVVMSALLLLYAGLLSLRVLGFIAPTAVFLFALTRFLKDMSLKSAGIYALAYTLLAWSLHYVFTRFFVIDLPTF